MFLSNRRQRQQEAAALDQEHTAAQGAEQIRLGKSLFDTLKPIAEQNEHVCGGTIHAAYLEQNAGSYSVMIMFKDGSFQDCMMQFDINLKADKLSCCWKYKNGPVFTADQFEEFVKTATDMVYNFK